MAAVSLPGGCGGSVSKKQPVAGGASERGSVAACVSSDCATAPVINTQPRLTGGFQQGQTLATTPGTWMHGPNSYSYRWLRCNAPEGESCSLITGATTRTYTTQMADRGSTVRAVVTARNATASADFYSNATGVISGPCTTTYTPAQAASRLSPTIAGAAPGSVFCISGEFTNQISIENGMPAGMVYLEPSPGHAKEAASWRVDDGGGNVTIENFGGPTSVICTGGSGTCNTANVEILNNAGSGDEIHVTNVRAHANIYVARNLLYRCYSGYAGTKACDTTDDSFLSASGDSGCPSGVTFAHNSILTTWSDLASEGGSCGVTWQSNDMENVVGGYCRPVDYKASLNNVIHCDGFQDNGGSKDSTLDGNYLNNVETCFTAGSSGSLVITNNVCVNSPDDQYPQWQLGTISTGVFKHNDKLDASAGSNIAQTHCAGPDSSNITVIDNIQYQPLTDNCDGKPEPPTGRTVIGFNVCRSRDYFCPSGSHDLSGEAAFTGGTPQFDNGGRQTTTWGGLTAADGSVTPGSWTFFRLTRTSAGHNAAEDGADIGVPAAYFEIGTTYPSGTLPGLGG